MNLFLAEEYMSIGDAAIFALVGFVIVVLVLFALVFILMLVAKVTNANIELPWKKHAAATETVTSDGEEIMPAGNDAAVVAAISAAVAVILTEQKAAAPTVHAIGDAEDDVPPPFIIKSIRKI